MRRRYTADAIMAGPAGINGQKRFPCGQSVTAGAAARITRVDHHDAVSGLRLTISLDAGATDE